MRFLQFILEFGVLVVNGAFFSETLGKNLYICIEIKCKRPGDLGKVI